MSCQSCRKFAPFCDLLLQRNAPLVRASSKSDNSKSPSPFNVQQRHWRQQQLKLPAFTAQQVRTWRLASCLKMARRRMLYACTRVRSGEICLEQTGLLRPSHMPDANQPHLQIETLNELYKPKQAAVQSAGYTVKRLLRFAVAGNCCIWNTCMLCWVSRICCSCRASLAWQECSLPIQYGVPRNNGRGGHIHRIIIYYNHCQVETLCSSWFLLLLPWLHTFLRCAPINVYIYFIFMCV